VDRRVRRDRADLGPAAAGQAAARAAGGYRTPRPLSEVLAALHQAWDAQLVHAEHAAGTLAAGPGRLGIHRGRVRTAQQHLDTWTATWSPVFAGSDPLS
jgi:hypothetical protein